MNFDTDITLGFGETYIGLTPLEFSYDKSWGATFNILKFSFHLKENQSLDNIFSLLSYTNTKYLHQLKVFGVNIFCKYK